MDIVKSKANGVLVIEFNRPEKKNAITAAMYQDLADTLRAAEDDDQIRTVLITGKPTIFTAGNDLEDFLKNPPEGKQSPLYAFLAAISHASKPIIASVAGAAVGIGTTLLLHCDLVYVAENAKFSLPFTQIGLCPEAASSMLLPQLLGYQRAAEKLLLGESFGAHEALEIGLVNRVFPIVELDEFVRKQAEKLAALPVSSIRRTKQLMKASQLRLIDAQISAEACHFSALLAAPEAKEAFSAFLEKRRPDFSQFR